MFRLLCVGGDPKTVKGEQHGYLTGLVYLAPHKLSGLGNVCPHASPGCATGCLNTAGRGAMPLSQAARIRKTRLFFTNREEYLRILDSDLDNLKLLAASRKLKPCARLNATSDIPWEKFGVMDRHRDLQFYDYTKNPDRMRRFLNDELPVNYHLTFSRSETNEEICQGILDCGGNVAVVFAGDLPATWHGYPVISGDKHDLRFLDDESEVVGLKAKGRAKRDQTGFVVRLQDQQTQ
jgi:hypothetical protein